MIRFLCLIQPIFVLAWMVLTPVHLVWADDSVDTGKILVATATVTAKSKTKLTAAPTPVVKKGFQWFLKNGCNCAQCRAFRQQQEEEQQRLKDTFQP